MEKIGKAVWNFIDRIAKVIVVKDKLVNIVAK